MFLLQVGLVILSLQRIIFAYQYNEELLVENLSESHSLLHFEFTSQWTNDHNNNHGNIHVDNLKNK